MLYMQLTYWCKCEFNSKKSSLTGGFLANRAILIETLILASQWAVRDKMLLSTTVELAVCIVGNNIGTLAATRWSFKQYELVYLRRLIVKWLNLSKRSKIRSRTQCWPRLITLSHQELNKQSFQQKRFLDGTPLVSLLLRNVWINWESLFLLKTYTSETMRVTH